MSRRAVALIAVAMALLAATIAIVHSRRPDPALLPAPDLTGDWKQPGDSEWYHIATIEGDTIEVWYYLPSEDLRELYWSGTFVPPENGAEPYQWESHNHYTEEDLGIRHEYRRTSREPVKTFTYREGRLTYIVTAGHLQMTFGLEKLPEGATFQNN